MPPSDPTPPPAPAPRRHRRPRWPRPAALAVALAAAQPGPAALAADTGPRFLDDDPLRREPEAEDAAGARAHDVSLVYELGYNLFVTPRRSGGGRALDVNTADEVPDSSWFTNRIGARPLAVDELRAGPAAGPPPARGRWTVIRPKTSGDAPGFTAVDGRGETWFLSFDPPGHREAATAAVAIASRIFWALGYHQVETHLTRIRPEEIDLDLGATRLRPNGKRTPMTRADLREVLERAARDGDGSYRAVAGRPLPGRVLGPSRFQGTRPDDPNDVVPHEHRRSLRALRVFGAWTNLTDWKAQNALDTVVSEGGRGIVKHYLQDVGSTFGIGANGPHDWDEGWEHVYEGRSTLRRLASLGFALAPWQTVRYQEHPSVGRFEGDRFEPAKWKPRVPTLAYQMMRADDAFWAARRVMAFDDDRIRAVVAAGELSDPAAERLLAEVLIRRRDAIGRAYLTALNPIVDPALDPAGVLTFANAAVAHGLAAAPEAYRVKWFAFDNQTGQSTPLGETTGRGEAMAPPTALPAGDGAFVRLELAASSGEHPSWAQPVEAWFRRRSGAFELVGLERLPDR